MNKLTPSGVRRAYWIIEGIGLLIALAGAFRDMGLLAVIGIAVLFGGILFYALCYTCPACGRHLGRDKAEYCPHCGKKIEE